MRPLPRILIAEDDFAFRDGVVDALADEGHVVAVARDGSEALAALKHLARPALILLDLQMPVLDGVGFLRKLRERPDRTDFEVVVMSATVAGEWFDHAPGVLRALKKPFDVAEILAIVDEFVDRHAPAPRSGSPGRSSTDAGSSLTPSGSNPGPSTSDPADPSSAAGSSTAAAEPSGPVLGPAAPVAGPKDDA